MEKVYVLTIDWSIKFESGNDVQVFADRESAIEQLKVEFAAACEDMSHIEEPVIEDDIETQGCFSVYEDGSYCENHIDGEIREEVVKSPKR